MKKSRLLLLLLIVQGAGILPMVEATAEPASPSTTIRNDEQVLTDADALMKRGEAARAYALLEAYEFDRAGEVRFDYLLGIAALDSGRPDKATLAFERVLAVNPNFAGARLDMARAFFNMGDLPRAKSEFQVVMSQNPPAAAKTTVQKYLQAIQAREEARKTQITGYIEGMVGRDTNVNNSTSQTEIAVPAFGNLIFTLNPSNIKTADNYVGIAGGANIDHQVNDRFGLYLGADLRQRSNIHEKAFNTTNLDSRAGLSFSSGSESVRAGIIAGRYNLAGEHNRDMNGLNLEWRHALDPATLLTVLVQNSRNRFAIETMKINDFNLSILGLGGLHLWNEGKSVLFGSLLYGIEDDTAVITATNPLGGRADGNKRMSGFRIGGQNATSENTEFFVNAGFQLGKYDKLNAAFMAKRLDRQSDLSVGVNWHSSDLWTIRPQIMWMRNDSNIPIYSFDRIDYSITIRKDLK